MVTTQGDDTEPKTPRLEPITRTIKGLWLSVFLASVGAFVALAPYGSIGVFVLVMASFAVARLQADERVRLVRAQPRSGG